VTPIVRALMLRCPRCGERGVFSSWFKMKDECPVCALSLRRSAESDEWFGGYFVNLIASESLMLIVVAGYVLAKWPTVPWTNVEILGVVMVIVSPIISYPFAKMLWVAIELIFAERR
ncbi:MAG TPA: DUF983 domain-containing protein, partial [Gemmatimonadaceae bacterium]|nr:DUF983 domain-containing protein [Gemmatimonadaceae bacterium]